MTAVAHHHRKTTPLRNTLQVLLVVSWFVAVPFVVVRSETTEDVDPSMILPLNVQEACSQGTLEVVQKALDDNPHWVNGRTPQGESCLHLAGIMGQTDITRLILERGGDPNIRTTFEKGQRMHPLSWNVYGGHVDTARVLLEHGANVNLEVDWMMGRQFDKGTPLDLLLDILPPSGGPRADRPEQDKFFQMKELLLEYGAMTYSDLEQASEL